LPVWFCATWQQKRSGCASRGAAHSFCEVHFISLCGSVGICGSWSPRVLNPLLDQHEGRCRRFSCLAPKGRISKDRSTVGVLQWARTVALYVVNDLSLHNAEYHLGVLAIGLELGHSD
jgi:hypothetical protein